MKLLVKPSRIRGSIAVTGSKSHTIRGIAAALMADGVSTLYAPLESADTRSTLEAAKLFGAKVREFPDRWEITGTGGRFADPGRTVDLGNSGTGLRMLTSLAALQGFRIGFDGDASLRTRLMSGLLGALEKLGATVESSNGKCPFSIRGPLRGGATTGGTDMAARMIHNRFQHISVVAILFLIDCCVVLMAGFFIEAEYALYAFASLYASSRLIDVVMVGLAREKACYIISTQHERVKQEIMQKLDRGVTVLRAEGGYSGQERPVLLCVLSAQEMGRLKAIVREADEDAFLFISDAHEVLGEGFRRLME